MSNVSIHVFFISRTATQLDQRKTKHALSIPIGQNLQQGNYSQQLLITAVTLRTTSTVSRRKRRHSSLKDKTKCGGHFFNCVVLCRSRKAH